MAWSYACAEFPGMQNCPGTFRTETEEELWRHLELHGAIAHGEQPENWSDDERRQIRDLIRQS
jgi:hypothetical protein